ncbi:MAG: hypothetical protein ACREOI_12850 [bacterium]
MASSYGSGRITGFFTGGRPELVAAVDRANRSGVEAANAFRNSKAH